MNKYEDPEYVLPLEWALYENVCPILAPIAHETLGLVPNTITTISNIFGILSIIFLYKNNYIVFFICSLIRQVLDALDGYVARKYKIFSKWGDTYDHVSDVIVYTLIILVFISKIKTKSRPIILMPLLFFTIFIFSDRVLRSECINKKFVNVCDTDDEKKQIMTRTRYLSFIEIKILMNLYIILMLKYFN